MRLKYLSRVLFLGVIFSAFVSVPAAYALFPKLTPAKIKKLGLQVSVCPQSVFNLTSGLSSGLLSKNSLCGSNFNKSKDLVRALIPNKYVLDGKYQTGVAFPDIIGQQGDVQTQPFDVINYPALINYSVEESDFKSTFRIAVVDAETGIEKQVIFRSHGSVEGQIAWNIPGHYYFKINAYGNAKLHLQPVYTVTMQYMDLYTGDRMTIDDLKSGGVKPIRCPKQIVDTETGSFYKIGKHYACTTKQSSEDLGFTTSPFSPGRALFMATELSMDGSGGTTSLPFRVKDPVAMTYSVSDPTEGAGGFDIFLVNLSTGKKTSLVDIKGNIDSTTTSLNVPGDYYLLIATSPSNPEVNGEISWAISLTGGQ